MESKYSVIAGRLRRDIQTGVYAERLPSERKLAEGFKTTQVTVRKALEILAGEGLLRKRPPLGTFVERQVRPRIRVSLLVGPFSPGIIKEMRPSFQRAFPAVDIDFCPSVRDSTHYGDFDLLRSANLAPVAYSDFATPFPTALVEGFDRERYFGAAFDVHRIRGAYYGMPLLFSPVVVAAERTALTDVGVSPDPYDFDLGALLALSEFAARRKRPLWDAPLARTMVRSLVYSAGDDTNSLERVDPVKLSDLLSRCRLLLGAGMVAGDAEPPERSRPLLRFCCRQGLNLHDINSIALLAMPKELRAKTGVGGEFLLLNSRCAHPELAAAVAAHFLAPDIQQLLGRHRVGLPVLKSAALDSLDVSRYRDDVFFSEVRNLCTNSGTEYDFLHRLHSFVDDVIEGRMSRDELTRCLEYEIGMARKRSEVRDRLANEDAPFVVYRQRPVNAPDGSARLVSNEGISRRFP
jgi:hypothetical protein